MIPFNQSIQIDCSSIATDVNLNRTEQCQIMHRTIDCHLDSYIDYLSLFFCSLPNYDLAVNLFVTFTLFYLFTGIQTIASEFMCTSLFRITRLLALDQNLAGVTFFSFGVATPCIFSAIAGILNDKPRLVIGALFGSACFITQLIIGCIFVLQSFSIRAISFWRDVIFYALTILWVFRIFLWEKQLTRFDSYGFLLFYVVYVLVAFLGSRFFASNEEDKSAVSIESNQRDQSSSLDCSEVTVKTSSQSFVSKCSWFFKLPIELAVKLTTVQVKEEQPFSFQSHFDRVRLFVNIILGYQFAIEATHLNRISLFDDQVPLAIIVFGISICVAFTISFLPSKNKNCAKLLDYYTIFHASLMSIFWVYAICDEVVNLLRAISIRFGLSEELIGLTILAWGNASLDLFADIQIVLSGRPRVAFAATISAPLISLLLGVGIPTSLKFASHSELITLPLHMSSQMLLISGSVTIGLLLTAFTVSINGFQVFRPFGALLIFLYAFTMIAEFTLEYGFWSIPAAWIQ